MRKAAMIVEEQTGSCLEVGCLFDQTFLPELEADMDDVLIEIKNLGKCHE